MKTLNDYEMLNVRKDLANALLNKSLRLKKSFEQHEYTDDEIRQSCDNAVAEFMQNTFGADWENNDQAHGFYELQACDMRIGLENEMVELYHNLNN